MEIPSRPPYAAAIIKLLQGVVYLDDSHWHQLQSYLTPIQEYFGKIGLEVRNHEADGFAYLTQPETDPEAESEPLPRLTQRRCLSFPVTMLCVLLREELRQFDASNTTGKPVIGIEKIRDLVQLYQHQSNNEKQFRDKVDSWVNKIKELGFLRKLSGQENKYEIRRIIKAKVDAEALENLKIKLEEHATTSFTT